MNELILESEVSIVYAAEKLMKYKIIPHRENQIIIIPIVF